MTEPHRPLSVVTGASSGIGLELARAFAKHGFDLVVAADGNDIHRVAAELDAEAVQADLSTPEGVHELHAQIRHRHVTALARTPASPPAATTSTASSSSSTSTVVRSCTSRGC